MSLIVVDVESDGALLGTNSLVCFGAVVVDEILDKTFYGKTQPITDKYNKEALAVSGFTREQHEQFDHPQEVMNSFALWIQENSKGKPILISDNNGYDASWINWYFLTYTGKNPFGWSSRRIGDLFSGFYNDLSYNWKKHRVTKHTHNPVDDAKGNAEALLYLMRQGFKLKI
jgi:hypothetical protein